MYSISVLTLWISLRCLCRILSKQKYNFPWGLQIINSKIHPYPPWTFSDSLKERTTWRLNLTSLSTASKVLSQTAAALHIHMERLAVLCRRAHTTTHPHPNGLPGKGAQIILSGLPVVQSTYMGQSGVDVWVRVEDGEVLRGNLPSSDGRPNDNKCQILVQTPNRPSIFFLYDILPSPHR